MAAQSDLTAPAVQSGGAAAPPERIYDFLRASDAHLEIHPSDDATRLLAAREYLRLGIGAAALEILAHAGANFASAPELNELTSLARRQARIVAWERRARRFERNLHALEQRNIRTDEIRSAWLTSGAQLELHLDASSGEQVRKTLPDGRRRWERLGPNPAPTAATLPLPADSESIMPGPYLFDGLALPEYFVRIWRATRNTFHGYDAALYVLEPDLRRLALALNLCDLAEPLADEAVLLFLGADCQAAFQRTLESDPHLPPPKQCFDFAALYHTPDPEHRAAVSSAARVETMIADRQARLTSALARLDQKLAPRDAVHYAARFAAALSGSGPPLRILATTSTRTTYLQYSMRDALQALEELGCETKLLIESRRFEIIGPETYHRAIDQFDPDLVFVIDHPRSSFVGRIPRNLPLMTWDQDALPHIFTPANLRQMGPLDALVGLSHVPEIVTYGLDPAQFFVSQAAANPQRFACAELTEDERQRYTCDVSYVSHASQTPREFHDQERAVYRDPNAGKLLDALFELATAHVTSNGSVDEGDLSRLLRAGEQATGIHVPQPPLRERFMTWYLWRLCDRVFRHQALEWAARFAEQTGRSLRIYGNGWDRHPTLARWAAGPAANGRELACIHRASQINLQLMPAGFLHQRALDGLCAGGFFLVRATPADTRDPRVPRVLAAIEHERFTSAADLLGRATPAAQADFLGVGERIGRSAENSEITFQWILAQRQWDYPSEVFARYGQIVFADERGFGAAAERFLQSAPLRSELAGEMRSIVVERYSYRATMQRFLRFFAEFLKSRAAQR